MPPVIDGKKPSGEFRVPTTGRDSHWFYKEVDGTWSLKAFRESHWPFECDRDGGKRFIAIDVDQPPVPQPQQWYCCQHYSRPVMFIGTDSRGHSVWQWTDDPSDDECGNIYTTDAKAVEHLPDCDGFDWDPFSSETTTEDRLREVGVELVPGGYRLAGESTGDSVVLAPDTCRRLEAIVAHIKQQEGGETFESL
ncbi:MAG: hypothetical protein NXI04_02020 [Planctomycetaceae bacterium]|nr:hypothetical protein [Planctomycetaceae bacterium]